jgi:hypothetical protein
MHFFENMEGWWLVFEKGPYFLCITKCLKIFLVINNEVY